MKPSRRPVLACLSALLPGLLVLSAACASAEQADRDVAWLVRHGRYDEAVEKAAREAERRPGDESAQENHRLASTAWLLERGRRLAFKNRNTEALEVFQEAERLEPDSDVVRGWIRATLERLADEWFERGLAAHNREDFDGAIVAYEQALAYVPDHRLSRETLARALLQQNHRAGMGEDYYNGGVRALDRYFLYEANSLFAYVLKYEPENDRASRRRDQTEELLAIERAAMAAELEDAGEYAASRNEYRLALLIDPTLEQAQEGLERTRVEEQVAEMLREAERMFLQQRYDEAEQRLVAAEELTACQGEAIQAYRTQLEEARLESQYEAARTLESDWRYEEAVAAYDVLLEGQPFYRDAIARRDTLASYVEQARELYARYEAAGNDEERLTLLRQIAVFWPEFRDVRRRLNELEGAQPEGR